MIEVKLIKDKDDNIKAYSVIGHATDEKICAGISALSQTTLLALINIGEYEIEKIEYDINAEIGSICVILPYVNNTTNIITKYMEIGIKNITKHFPDQINITEEVIC